MNEIANPFLRYQALGEPERSVMLMKALIGPAVGKTLFLDCLARSGIAPPEGGWTIKIMNPMLERLRGQGLLDGEYACIDELQHPLSVEAAAREEGPAMIAAVAQTLPGLAQSTYGFRTRGYDNKTQENDAYRRLRLCVYANDEEDYAKVWELYGQHDRYVLQRISVFDRAFVGVDCTADWLGSRKPWFRRVIVEAKLARLVASGNADSQFPEVMTQLRTTSRTDPEDALLWGAVAEYEILRANPAGLRDLLGDRPPDASETRIMALIAACMLLEGDLSASVATYQDALRHLYKQTRKRKGLVLPGIHGLLYLMALLKADDSSLHAEIETAVKTEVVQSLVPGYAAARALLALARNREPEAKHLLAEAMSLWPLAEPMAAAMLAIAEMHINPQAAREYHFRTVKLFKSIRDTMPLVAGMLAEVLEQVAKNPLLYREFLANPGRFVTIRFAQVVEEKESWQRALASLETALFPAGFPAGVSGAEAGPARARRLVWFISPDGIQIEVAEQTARGANWTSGRAVALKRLQSLDPTLDYLDEADRRVARTIKKYSLGWHSQENWDFDLIKTLTALIGHPRVFDLRDRRTPVELAAGSVELLVQEEEKGLRIALSHVADTPTVVVSQETPNRWLVVSLDQKAVDLAATLGEKGLLVPKAGRAQVEALVRRSGPSLPLRVEIESDDVEATAGDATPVVRLLPLDGGFKVTLVIRPAGPQGPSVTPGQGAKLLSVSVAGRPMKVLRDIEAERAAAESLINACSTLASGADASSEWLLGGIAEGLELLTEIGSFAGQVTVEWPHGRPLSVRGEASATAMKVAIGGSAEWFSVSGTVAVDEDLVLDLKDLLDRLDKAEGRFVPLDDGRFLALTRAFRAQLDRLKALAETRGAETRGAETRGAETKGDALRLTALRMAVMNDLFEDAGSIKGDKRWREFAKRLKAAADWQPEEPTTLQAELRDYQREGFVWMMRLARWGAGACLADDMGLGKTVQAIGVLLSVASEGPCLVVAPTSVCGNWETELTRFAPSLTVHRLSDASDRAEQVSGLKAGEVLIASYGLLTREEERLTAVEWRVAVVDEAQAIKNPDTRRTQAAMKLKAGFRLVLTGTPVENRLDELWSLLSFANPGLLGSRNAFQANFAIPIERDRSPAVRQSLKALVRPFLLRRTKGAVLSELPPRTEQTLLIELSEPERALYEALRQKALERLSDLGPEGGSGGGGPGGGGSRRIHILAELTRLRQACCHPALAMPDEATDMPSSKLETFIALVEELKAGGHRALVFSQFVRHLDKIRSALDPRGITYQYLDGSTPVRAREAAVAAFQAGKGDLFLISLKAGGFGLNLTAADYVLHMDPWWNPAVEDQASDRAHRIGQHRPVTIYRLVVRDSVEERIVALHARKRDLADAVLEGAESSATLSEDDLLALIRG